MNCENVRPRLLDLLGGDLPADEVASVRAHVDGCDACRHEQAQLAGAMQFARRLPVEEPSPRIREALLARARTVSELRRSNPSLPERAVSEDESGVAQFMRWISGFVLGPQVAMAMVLLLMVGVGLFYLPGLRRDRAVEGGAIVNADPGGEAGPTTTIQPAAPLDLRLDTRTNRLQPAGEGGEQQVAEAARATTGGTTPAELEEPAAGTRVEASPSATLVAGSVTEPPPVEPADDATLDSPALRPQLAARVASSTVAAEAAEPFAAAPAAPPPSPTGADEDLAARSTERAEEMFESDVQARSGPTLVAESSSARRARSAEVLASPAAPAPARAPASDIGRATGGLASGSMGAAPAPMAGGAASTSPGGSPVMRGPASLHAAARTQAQSGQTRAAIASYEALLAAHPTYERAPEAMLELAELHRRNGNLANARTWLARAERSPAYAARVRAARARIDATERAPAAAPAAAASESH